MQEYWWRDRGSRAFVIGLDDLWTENYSISRKKPKYARWSTHPVTTTALTRARKNDIVVIAVGTLRPTVQTPTSRRSWLMRPPKILESPTPWDHCSAPSGPPLFSFRLPTSCSRSCHVCLLHQFIWLWAHPCSALPIARLKGKEMSWPLLWPISWGQCLSSPMHPILILSSQIHLNLLQPSHPFYPPSTMFHHDCHYCQPSFGHYNPPLPSTYPLVYSPSKNSYLNAPSMSADVQHEYTFDMDELFIGEYFCCS